MKGEKKYDLGADRQSDRTGMFICVVCLFEWLVRGEKDAENSSFVRLQLDVSCSALLIDEL